MLSKNVKAAPIKQSVDDDNDSGLVILDSPRAQLFIDRNAFILAAILLISATLILILYYFNHPTFSATFLLASGNLIAGIFFAAMLLRFSKH